MKEFRKLVKIRSVTCLLGIGLFPLVFGWQEYWNAELFHACAKGSVQGVDMALNMGANINCRHPKGGFTPLMLSIIQRRTLIALHLIKKGADLSLKNIAGKTAIFFAMRVNADPELINALTRHGSQSDQNYDK